MPTLHVLYAPLFEPVKCLACVDFPESTPAVEDLKFCLERTNQRQQLLTSLKSAFETRLLHPGTEEITEDETNDSLSLNMAYLKIFLSITGVHTSDIITVYISAIKALRELDPSMVILQVACQPIRKYLRWVFYLICKQKQTHILKFHLFI